MVSVGLTSHASQFKESLRSALIRIAGVLSVGALLALTAACGETRPTAAPIASSAPSGVQPSPPSTPTTTPDEPLAQVPGSPTALPRTSPTPSPTVAVRPSPIVQPMPSPTARESGTDTLASSGMSTEPPDRDLFELALRLRPTSGESISRVANPEPVTYQEGHRQTFWVSDTIGSRAYTVEATLKVVSKHAYWYVDDTLDLPIEGLEEAAEVYESRIHPSITASFGDIWNPGVDNDPRLTVLHTPLTGVSGYFGSSDEYPRETHPRSNEREMIYIDGIRLKPGSRAYLGVLAHELQHAVHWNLDPGEDAWLNEGMSEVGKELAGYRASFVNAFLARPGTQLNYWPDEPGRTGPHYGAATLFVSYLAQHYGGYGRLKELAQQPADGINGGDAYLMPYGTTFLDVFKDWVVANYLDAAEGAFGYPDRSVRVRDVDIVVAYGDREDMLPQFAAHYIDLRLGEGDAVVSFQGDSEVAQVGTRCHSGRHCWWGNRGDSIDSTLTREFDLSGLNRATLEFWTWFRVEEDWDYGYIQISDDGGRTWAILEGRHTTSDNPIGNNFGEGLTGSTEGWVEEKVDLTPYVGGKVLLRFEYVTDDAVFLDGFVVDDLSIPELGFFDDAERDRGWEAEGFRRIDNALPQDYAVRVIEVPTDGEVSVRDVPLNEDRRGEILIEGFGSRLGHAVIVVSPVTPHTRQPARYTLSIRQADGDRG